MTIDNFFHKERIFHKKQGITKMFDDFESDSVFTPEQILENRGRVAIFIDGSNLFYAALQLGIEIDYTKLLHRLTAGSRLLRAFFYTGVDRTNEKQQGFLLWMRRNGYRVIAKDLVQLPDGSKKANLDVEIAVDLMALVGSYDTAVIVSGDGDLAYAADAVSYRGARVEVVSLRSMTSDSLINVADRYIDLDQIKEEIQKMPKTSVPYSAFPSIGVLDEEKPR
jgi:uncharacterized LabA/DUF88 family protein